MFNSTFEKLGKISLPAEKSITKILMMPIIIGDNKSIPNTLSKWFESLNQLYANVDPRDIGKIGYLTIDEKPLVKGQVHRTKGIHVDGVFKAPSGTIASSHGGGGHGGNRLNNTNKGGFYLVSNHIGCRAWNQVVDGYPGSTGECEHLEPYLKDANLEVFQEDTVYWLDRLCVHESIPMDKDCHRQLIRLSSPNDYPWIDHFTSNPLGIMPEGEIVSKDVYFSLKAVSQVREKVVA